MPLLRENGTVGTGRERGKDMKIAWLLLQDCKSVSPDLDKSRSKQTVSKAFGWSFWEPKNSYVQKGTHSMHTVKWDMLVCSSGLRICGYNMAFVIHKVAVTFTNRPGIFRNNPTPLFIEILLPSYKGKIISTNNSIIFMVLGMSYSSSENSQ